MAGPFKGPAMLGINLQGKRALVVGVADDQGFGFAIAKAMAEAGARVSVGTWPPALGIFKTLLQRGKLDESLTLASGEKMQFERIFAVDAEYDALDDLPAELRESKRYRDQGDVSLSGLASRVKEEFGEDSLDVVVHSLANGPEVQKPLLETSRKGYLGAMGASAYSFVSLVAHLAPLVRQGGSFMNLSYLAAERVIPGYGGGMSSAKAALESDTRLLAFEAGRKWGHRINCISAGPWSSRAASAIGEIERMMDYYRANSPLPENIVPADVGHAAAFLASPLAAGITGAVIHVDKGFHAMGMAATEIL